MTNRTQPTDLRARLDAALSEGEVASVERVLRESFWRPSSRVGVASVVPIARR